MGIREKILTYLSVYGKENRYRLASVLKIEVNGVTKALGALEKEGRIKIKGGRAIFVKGKPITPKPRKQKKQPKVEKEEPEEKAEVEPEKEQPEEIPAEKEEEQVEETEKVEEAPSEEQPEETKTEEPAEGLEGLEVEKKLIAEKIKKTFGVKEEERIKGTVKFFNANKGFGFITGDDGEEYYIHKNAVKEGVTIEADNRVSFKPVEGDKGLKAEEVEWISQA